MSFKKRMQSAYKEIDDWLKVMDIKDGKLDEDDWKEINDTIKDVSHDIEDAGESYGHDERQDIRATLRNYTIRQLKKIGNRDAE